MLTGQGTERVAVQALKMGVQDYLIKNRAAETVKYVVQSVIEKAALSRQIKEQRRRTGAQRAGAAGKRRTLPAMGRASTAGERGAIPAADRRCDGLSQSSCSTPTGHVDPVERRGGETVRLSRRRDHWPRTSPAFSLPEEMSRMARPQHELQCCR